jgi:hypothetical protein
MTPHACQTRERMSSACESLSVVTQRSGHECTHDFMAGGDGAGTCHSLVRVCVSGCDKNARRNDAHGTSLAPPTWSRPSAICNDFCAGSAARMSRAVK